MKAFVNTNLVAELDAKAAALRVVALRPTPSQLLPKQNPSLDNLPIQGQPGVALRPLMGRVVPLTETQSVAIGPKDLVARHMDSVGKRLPIVEKDVRVGHASVLQWCQPPDLHLHRPTQTQVLSK